MTDILKRPVALAIIAVVALIILINTVVIVPETKQALIVRFGQPQNTYNQYRDNEQFGRTGAGLVARVPFIDDIVWVDKRVLDIEMEKQQVLSTDQLRLEVDAYARYRIIDPKLMFETARTSDRVSEELKPILGSALRNELGKRPFAALLSPERGGIMDRVQTGLDRVARQYGAQIIDVQIKRADLPEGTPLQSAFRRMQTAREQEARTITAQGQKNAQIIRAEADATAAGTYAESFGKDPEFYEFYRAMQSYERTFLAGSGETSMVLSPDNDYLREFQGR